MDAQRVRVEAIGEPGQRRFRLVVAAAGETVIVWMEKQQLQALGLALEQMLEQVPGEESVAGSGLPADFDLDTRRQFRVGRMELGYDERGDRFVIIAHDSNDRDEDEPALTCRLTRDQAGEISAEAAAVVAAGRPRCTMCGSPMGPGPHACPQMNGHFPHYLADIGDDDDEEEDE